MTSIEEIKKELEEKRVSLITTLGYDKKLCKDLINGRFFEGRVVIQEEYREFIEHLLEELG